MSEDTPKRLLKSDALPPGRNGQAPDEDARIARSGATGATEAAVSRRPVRSGGQGFDLQQPPNPNFVCYRGDKPPRFATQTELDAAKILDYYRVPWAYEPRTFILESDPAGNIVEAFTPDFYLPDLDLYLEVTQMKQSLVTAKNRKVRRLRELFPDVRIKLFYKHDFIQLAKKYDLTPPR